MKKSPNHRSFEEATGAQGATAERVAVFHEAPCGALLATDLDQSLCAILDARSHRTSAGWCEEGPRQFSRCQLMKQSLLGYEVDAGSLVEIVTAIIDSIADAKSPRVLACLNPHSYVVALRDPQFARALSSADWLIPDGIGMVPGSR